MSEKEEVRSYSEVDIQAVRDEVFRDIQMDEHTEETLTDEMFEAMFICRILDARKERASLRSDLEAAHNTGRELAGELASLKAEVERVKEERDGMKQMNFTTVEKIREWQRKTP